MEYQFVDPAVLKFVNKKFILSTNDKTNPVTLVRQLNSSNSNEVLISLKSGETYTDIVTSVTDLIDVTSNLAYKVQYELTFTFHSYLKSKNNVEPAIEMLSELDMYDFENDISNDLLPESAMIPRRVTLLSTSILGSADILTEGRYYNDRARVEGTAYIDFVVISPENVIEELSEVLANSIVGRFRNADIGSERFDRNITYSISKIDLAYGVEKMRLNAEPETEMIIKVGSSKFLYPDDANEILHHLQITEDVDIAV